MLLSLVINYSLHPLKQFVLELLRSFAKEFVSRAWDEFVPRGCVSRELINAASGLFVYW